MLCGRMIGLNSHPVARFWDLRMAWVRFWLCHCFEFATRATMRERVLIAHHMQGVMRISRHTEVTRAHILVSFLLPVAREQATNGSRRSS
jgi:hypothetical protein